MAKRAKKITAAEKRRKETKQKHSSVKKLAKTVREKTKGSKGISLENPDDHFQSAPKSQSASRMGLKFWMNKSKHGREKIFSSPEAMAEAAEEYFNYVDENPWLRAEYKGGRMVR